LEFSFIFFLSLSGYPQLFGLSNDWRSDFVAFLEKSNQEAIFLCENW